MWLIMTLFLNQLAFEHFRFQDKAALGDDVFTRLHAIENLHAARLLQTEFDRAFLKLAPIERDENDLVVTVGLQRVVWNEQHVIENRSDDLHVGKHARLQTAVGVVHGDANFDRARTSLHLVANEHHLAVKLLLRIGQRRESRILTHLYRRDVALLHFGDGPKLRRVADRVDFLGLVHQLAGGGLAIDDHAINLRFDLKLPAEQFRRLDQSHHLARLHAVVQVEVKFGQPAYKRRGDLGSLVQVGTDAAGRLEGRAETAQRRGFNLQCDMLQVLRREGDDIFLVFGFRLRLFNRSEEHTAEL